MVVKPYWVLLLASLACSRNSGVAESGGGEHTKAAGDVSSSTSGESAEPGPAQPMLPVGLVEIEAPPRQPLVIKAEVASSPGERQMGLMYRRHMGPDEGMLFVFPTEQYNSFWMRNTLLPLDMVFIDSEWTVVGILQNVPPLNDEPRRVSKMSQYVLEVNAGVTAAHQIGVGAKVRFTAPTEVER